MLTITAYDAHVEQLFEVVKRAVKALERAKIPYRLVGGLAVFLHVREKDPMVARVTRDLDVAINRADLDSVIRAAKSFGFVYRHAAGVDMLVDAQKPAARSAVHLLFVRERVRPTYVEPVPDFSEPARTTEGILLAPVADLVRMKLTSYRLKDRVHIQDLDSVGLITSEIEGQLPETLLKRLQEIRAAE